MKILVTQIAPSTCYCLSLGPKYAPQHFRLGYRVILHQNKTTDNTTVLYSFIFVFLDRRQKILN
jgi:hypothetical protein